MAYLDTKPCGNDPAPPASPLPSAAEEGQDQTPGRVQDEASSIVQDPAPAARTVLFPPPNATVIDQNGDLYLHVGSEKQAFRVDSHAMIRASKVFQSLLTHGWAESRPKEGAWIVELPATDGITMEVLLRIMHGNAPKIKSTDLNPSIKSIYELAIAADMYSLGGCLGPWCSIWCNQLSPLLESITHVMSLGQLAWIAKVFDHPDMFDRAFQQLTVHVRADTQGTLVDDEGVALEELIGIQSMDITAVLKRHRHSLIACLLSVVEDTLAEATTKDTENLPEFGFCRAAPGGSPARIQDRQDCNIRILGLLVQSLGAVGLFPLPRSCEDVRESAYTFRASLERAVKRIKTHDPCHVGGVVHHKCNPMEALEKEMDTAWDETAVWCLCWKF